MFDKSEDKIFNFLARAGNTDETTQKTWTPCDAAKNIRKGDILVVRKGDFVVADMPYKMLCAVVVDEVKSTSYVSGTYSRIEGSAFTVEVDHIETSKGSSWKLSISKFFK